MMPRMRLRRAFDSPPTLLISCILYSLSETSNPATTARRIRPGEIDMPAVFLFRLFDECAVLVAGTEIDVDTPDLVAGENEKLGVAKALAALGCASVGHESLVALDENFFELMPLDPVAVLPAALEIGLFVDLVVIGAGETEIVRKRILHDPAVIAHVGVKNGADGCRAGCRDHSPILLRDHAEIRLGLLHHARDRPPRLQAFEIGDEAFVVTERLDHAGIKQRRQGGAIGHRERFADCPAAGRHLLLDHAIRCLELRPRLLHAMRIPFVRRAKPVDHDLLHRQMHIEIVEAVAQSRLQRELGIFRDEPRPAWIMPVEVFDDDAGFRDGLAARLVAQHRKLADRPQFEQRGAFGRVAEIDRVRRERDVVLVKRDQRLPAERRQRMVMQRECHACTLYRLHNTTGCILGLLVRHCKWFFRGDFRLAPGTQPMTDTDRRSGCPINLTLEVVGDKWSLLVIRDMMFGNRRHFRELLTKSEERISSNILADRLKTLLERGIVTRDDDPSHKQKGIYSLTEQGIELLPILAQMSAWGYKYLPVSEELGIRARLLSEGGPKMWAEFMDELRETHLGVKRRRKAGPSAGERLQAAYEKVVARKK